MTPRCVCHDRFRGNLSTPGCVRPGVVDLPAPVSWASTVIDRLAGDQTTRILRYMAAYNPDAFRDAYERCLPAAADWIGQTG